MTIFNVSLVDYSVIQILNTMNNNNCRLYFLFPIIVASISLFYVMLLITGAYEPHIGAKCVVEAKIDATITIEKNGEEKYSAYVDNIVTYC